MFHKILVAFATAAALGRVPVPTSAFAASNSGAHGSVGLSTGEHAIAGHARGGNAGGRYAIGRGGRAYGSYGGYGGYDQTIFALPRLVETTIPDFAGDRLTNPHALDLAVAGSVPTGRSARSRLESALPQKIAPPIVDRFARIDPRALRPTPSETPEPRINYGRAMIKINIPILPPLAYTRFCLEYSWDCERRGVNLERRTVALTAERWIELTTVNRQINHDIVSRRDEGGVLTEEWRVHPVAGNCHDYAVTKRHELLAQGWPSSSLLLFGSCHGRG